MNALGSSNTTNWPPASVKIGALLDISSTTGMFARLAIQLAVQDVNKAEDVLNGTQLVLEMFDTGSNPVRGAACGMFLYLLHKTQDTRVLSSKACFRWLHKL